MPSRKPSAAARGMGHAHRRARLIALPRFIGTRCPCPGCGKHRGPCRVVLTATNSDFDHSLPRVLGGTVADRFLCRPCNRSRGAALGNVLRGARARARRVAGNPSRSW